MKINKLNYENYIIDYIEGGLDYESKKAFDSFLSLHPEIKDEINEYLSAPVMEPDKTIRYEDKDLLLKEAKPRKLGIVRLGGLMLLGLSFICAYLVWNNFNQDDLQIKKTEVSTITKKDNVFSNNNTINESKIKEFSSSSEKKKDVKMKVEDAKAKEQKTNVDPEENQELISNPKSKIKEIENKIRGEQEESIPMAIAPIEEPKVDVVQEDIAAMEAANTAPAEQTELNEDLIVGALDQIEIPQNDRLKPVKKSIRSVEFTIANVTPATYSSEKKNPAILDLFVPKSYKDLDLKESVKITSSGEKKSILKSFTPKSIGK